MTWTRFHAGCRRHANRPGSAFSDTLAFYRSGASTELFGPAPGTGALPSRLMSGLAAMTDEPARDAAIRAYAGVDFDGIGVSPLPIKRVVFYLTMLAACCIGMVSILGVFVLPEIEAQLRYAGMETPNDPLVALVLSNVPVLVAVLALASIVIVVQAVALGRLLAFRLGPGRGSLLWLVLPPGLRRRYRLLEGVICGGLPSMLDEDTRREVRALEADGLNWKDELPGLARVQAVLLVNAADRHSKWLLATMGLLIALSVSTFVIGIYTPIFHLGRSI